MASKYLEVATTPAVEAAQRKYYGRASVPLAEGAPTPLGAEEAQFIAARDSFYLGTVSETGWPYIQHRGGPPGFLRVLDAHTLAFADLRGNRQLLSTGNLAVNDRVALFLMDYPHRERLKIMGHARILDPRDEPAPISVPASTERIFVVQVVSFDWNCPQHITQRYTCEEWEAASATEEQ